MGAAHRLWRPKERRQFLDLLDANVSPYGWHRKVKSGSTYRLIDQP